MTTDLVPIHPETAAEIAESWSSLSKDARKRRAAKASAENDRDELKSLMIAHVITWGRAGASTSDQTLKTYWRGAKKLLDWSSANTLYIHQIEPETARRFAASLNELSPKSQSTYLSGAKAMVAALRWTGLGSGNPFHGIRVRDNRAASEKADPYTDDELSALLSVARPRDRVLLLLGADAGLRLNESTQLQWSDIDFEQGRIKVEGKGGRIAKVKATRRLLKALQKIRENNNEGPVFGVSLRRIQQLFNNMCLRAVIRCRGYHQLRHSCGTRLYRQSKDLALVARHLRHSSTKTSEIYITLSDSDYDEAVLALEKNGIDVLRPE